MILPQRSRTLATLADNILNNRANAIVDSTIGICATDGHSRIIRQSETGLGISSLVYLLCGLGRIIPEYSSDSVPLYIRAIQTEGKIGLAAKMVEADTDSGTVE